MNSYIYHNKRKKVRYKDPRYQKIRNLDWGACYSCNRIFYHKEHHMNRSVPKGCACEAWDDMSDWFFNLFMFKWNPITDENRNGDHYKKKS